MQQKDLRCIEFDAALVADQSRGSRSRSCSIWMRPTSRSTSISRSVSFILKTAVEMRQNGQLVQSKNGCKH